MKKSKIGIFLAVLTVAIILTVTLTGCSNTPPHKILKDTWLTNEVATYDVVRVLKDNDSDDANNVKIKGTQVMTTKRIRDNTILVGEKKFDNFNGSLVTIQTDMEDGSYLKVTFALNSIMRPMAIVRESFVKGHEFNQPSADAKQTLAASFDEKSYNYTITNNDGEPINQSLPLKKAWEKAPFFDTIQLYHIARSCFSGKNDAFTNLSNFTVPSYTENKLKAATITKVNSNFEIQIGETKYKTTQVAMNYNQKFPGIGAPIYAWYNNEAMEGAGARMLMQFQEGSMTYTLKSVTDKI